MGKYAQLIIGPAGAGKTTYSHTIKKHAETLKRNISLVNLDPAADLQTDLNYAIDIKELVTVDQVMEELNYGPNGGLIYAMEYLLLNFDWFEEQIGDYDDDYLLIDCPGQIELYGHVEVMDKFVKQLQNMGYNVCTVYLLDAVFITDSAKFLSGSLMALAAMLRLEVPHVNLLTKIDLMDEQTREFLNEQLLDSDLPDLLRSLPTNRGSSEKLNQALCGLLEEYGLLAFLPLDKTDDDSVESVMSHIDMVLQYGEDVEVMIPKDDDDDDDELEELKDFF